MEFFTAGEKLKNLRKQLGIKQHELEEANVTRSFISMVESGRKGLSKETAGALTSIFRRKAAEKGLDINISDDYLTTPPEYEAKQYCEQCLSDRDKLSDIFIIEDLIAISRKYMLVNVLENAYMLKGNYLYDKKEYLEAFGCYNEILELKLSKGEEDNLAFVYNKLAKCKISLTDYHEALTYLNKGYSYILLHEDKTVRKYIYYNLALCYKYLRDYDKSLDYADKFISLCDLQNEFQFYMSGIIMSCNCFIEKGYVDKAVQLYNQAIKKFSDERHPLLGFIYNNLGSVYIDSKDFRRALEYLQKAREIRENYDKSNLSHTLINIAKVHVAQNLREKAKELVYEALELARMNMDKIYTLDAYEVLEGLYAEEKDYDNLEQTYMAMLETLKDSKDEARLLKLSMRLSLLYMNTNKMEKAKNCLKNSLTKSCCN